MASKATAAPGGSVRSTEHSAVFMCPQCGKRLTKKQLQGHKMMAHPTAAFRRAQRAGSQRYQAALRKQKASAQGTLAVQSEQLANKRLYERIVTPTAQVVKRPADSAAEQQQLTGILANLQQKHELLFERVQGLENTIVAIRGALSEHNEEPPYLQERLRFIENDISALKLKIKELELKAAPVKQASDMQPQPPQPMKHSSGFLGAVSGTNTILQYTSPGTPFQPETKVTPLPLPKPAFLRRLAAHFNW